MTRHLLQTTYDNCLVAAIVFGVHVLAAVALTSKSLTSLRPLTAVNIPAISEAQILVQLPVRADVVMPEIQLADIHLETSALRAVQFDNPEDSALEGIIAPASVPRLREIQSVDTTFFAHRAGLKPGQAKTVVLAVEIGEDGQANQVDIALSSGDSATDAAAVAYALSLRWIPGTRERQPQRVRIRFPVTLALPQ